MAVQIESRIVSIRDIFLGDPTEEQLKNFIHLNSITSGPRENLDFLVKSGLADRLKGVIRRGWIERGWDINENDFQHSLEVGVLVMQNGFISGLTLSQVDRGVRQGLNHDLAEIIAGDETPYSYQAAELRDFTKWDWPTEDRAIIKYERERQAMTNIAEKYLDSETGSKVLNTWIEFNQVYRRKSPVATVVRDYDIAQAAMKAVRYIENHPEERPKLNAFNMQARREMSPRLAKDYVVEITS